MKWQYLIFDQDTGQTKGTNNPKVAQDLANDDYFRVIDCIVGEELVYDDRQTITEMIISDHSKDPDDE